MLRKLGAEAKRKIRVMDKYSWIRLALLARRNMRRNYSS
jgi:hypothetical protein